MKLVTTRFFTFFCCLFLLLAAVGQAEEQAATPGGGSEPIQIEADKMVSLKGENAVLFSGNVDAKQGDLIIRSDEMTVYYLSDEEKAQLPAGDTRKLKKLFATGNVEIQRGEGWTATGDNMEYFETERKVRLTGNAKVLQDNNLVTGQSVLLYLDEGKSIVERSEKSGERVKAFFYPGDEPQPAKEKGAE